LGNPGWVLHSAFVTKFAFLHLGFNLYNNSFSRGFVAMFLLAIIDVWNILKENLFAKLRRGGEDGNRKNSRNDY
jgi:hypothetical protein